LAVAGTRRSARTGDTGTSALAGGHHLSTVRGSVRVLPPLRPTCSVVSKNMHFEGLHGELDVVRIVDGGGRRQANRVPLRILCRQASVHLGAVAASNAETAILNGRGSAVFPWLRQAGRKCLDLDVGATVLSDALKRALGV